MQSTIHPGRGSIRAPGLHSCACCQQEKGFVFPGESHSLPELLYVYGGELHCVADGREILLNEGEMTVFGPNQWHMFYADMDVAPSYMTLRFQPETADISNLLNRKFGLSEQRDFLVQEMIREQSQKDIYSDNMLWAQLCMLLVWLLRETKRPGEKPNGENEIIRQAQQYVCNHMREKLSVSLVAQQIDMSASYLTALFHKHLDISPGEYIRRVKLQESKRMIREENMNFTEIAAALEYSTVHHYSRQFKEKFGITPSEYAKSLS